MSHKHETEIEALKQGKKIVEQRIAPIELEERLRGALFTTEDNYVSNTFKTSKSRRSIVFNWKGIVAAILFVVFLTAIAQSEAVAFLTRSQFGHKELVREEIAQLYENGKGQELNTEVRLLDGTLFVVDWITADANQTIISYTLYNESGLAEEYLKGHFSLNSLAGRFTDAKFSHGASELDTQGKKIIGVAHFEKVSSFASNLMLHYDYRLEGREYSQTDKLIRGELLLEYDSSKALATLLKKKIRRTFELMEGKIRVEQITATPTETIITGRYKLSNQLFKVANLSGMQLYVDGIKLDQLGTGQSSTMLGKTFEVRYAPLPSEAKTIELVLETFVNFETIHATMKLTDTPREYVYGEKIIKIIGIEQKDGQTKVTIQTKEGMLLDGVTLETDKGQVSLTRTIEAVQITEEDQDVWQQRSLIFETTDDPMHLLVKALKIEQPYDQSIIIMD